MAYKVVFEKSAAKSFDRMDKVIKKRIADFLKELRDGKNPRISGIAMQGAGHLWRYRVGDYRIIADIEDRTITITIIKIDHRGEVYR